MCWLLRATSLTDGLLFVCGKHSLHPRVGGFLWNWVEDEEGWRRMRGGQKGFGWGRVCHNGAARDSRASTLILCHSDQTLCYTVWYQTTLCATTLPLWQLPWVWRIACLPSWLPTPPLRRAATQMWVTSDGNRALILCAPTTTDAVCDMWSCDRPISILIFAISIQCNFTRQSMRAAST